MTSASVLQSLAAFALVAALLTITPGIDTLLVIRSTSSGGRRTGYLTGIGVCAGCLVWGVASALGVTALLATSRVAFDVLRLVGAAYLFWLGAHALWGSRRRSAAGRPGEPHIPGGGAGIPAAALGRPGRGPGSVPARLTPWTGFRRGLLTNLLNPKVGVFYVTLLPQFIPSGGPVLPLSVAMASIHAVEGLLWFALLVLLVERFRRLLEHPRATRAIERVSGVVFVGFGVRLAAERL